MADTPNYEINYDDERFTEIEGERDAAITESDQLYDGMIGGVDQYYDDLQDHIQNTADEQKRLQQENTDFTIEQIEQEKDKAHSDYLKEQSGAYVDWQKQSNQYGVNAEKMASSGLNNSGYSESSQVSMYNTYQNRVATARESFNYAVLNYNNAIKDAQLQNNAALAEIAANALEKQLQLALEGFQYKNQLLLDKANKKIELDNMYYQRYQDVLDQINTENALNEQIRQFTENQKFQAEQAELDRQFQAEQDRIQREFEAQQAELNRQHDKDMLEAKTKKEKELLELQHKKDMEKLAQQKANSLALLREEYKLKNQYSSSGGSGGGGYSITGSYNSSGSPKNTMQGANTVMRIITNKSNTASGISSINSYSSAVSYLKSKGINGSGAMTESEWSRRKNAGSTAAEVKNNASYKEYIQDYVAYKLSSK